MFFMRRLSTAAPGIFFPNPFQRYRMSTAPSFKPFKLALIQLGGVGPDKSANLKHAREMILKAAEGDGSAGSKPSLVVLPECFNSPYGHAHFPTYAETIGFTKADDIEVQTCKSESVKMLSSTAREANVWLVGGALVATHRKVHLFDIDIPGKITFKESETLTGGSSLNFFDTGNHPSFLTKSLGANRGPEFARIGLGICYDVRFPELAMISARKGCHVLIYPGAFNLTTGPLHWSLLQRARAVDNQVFFAMCSPARDMNAGYHAWGHSMVVDPFGKILAEAEVGESVVQVSIDPTVLYDARAGIPVTTQRRFDVYPDVNNAQ
ncbi:carbon-nitrogen hydrolase [Pisolithus orientalis]|uniref:carbon-nitrogen hydrolase n=1 Tax=Pisolithus orientalis TaxID=936130 RepID=UPI0022243972|nr:carbon-nitrogen hydrolase [Pisolithus orientalis]KAI6028291.1 carbon-nitrogen hydrolase [Pisolithus orientalis]